MMASVRFPLLLITGLMFTLDALLRPSPNWWGGLFVAVWWVWIAMRDARFSRESTARIGRVLTFERVARIVIDLVLSGLLSWSASVAVLPALWLGFVVVSGGWLVLVMMELFA